MPASLAALAISPTLSSNFLMLPGFTRTAAQPASIAANTYRGWKWMSAMTGICDFLAIAGSASASSVSGTATRTIWQPDAVSSAICCSVALMSAVLVVRHRLHADREVAADADAADVELPGLPAGGEDGRGCSRHAEADGDRHGSPVSPVRPSRGSPRAASGCGRTAVRVQPRVIGLTMSATNSSADSARNSPATT